MASPHRRFKLRIWLLALGYFIFYAPYSGLIRVTTSGQLPGGTGRVSGFQLLPAVVISTAVVLPIIISLKGWWKYVGHRQFFGLSIPCPTPLVLLSGLGTAIIIGTTTLAFTFTEVSILFALLLMRGGVLSMAPVVDLIFKRRVRWFSWAALALTLSAMLIALTDVNNHRLTVVAALTIAAYLSGYLLRLPCVTSLAKTDDKDITRSYFVEEMLVAMVFLVAIPAVFALIGKGEIMMQLRLGFTGLLVSSITIPGLVIGALYGCLYCFGTFIYLDCRENTFCIPLNRGSSLLAGVFASYALALFFGQNSPSGAQLGSAGMIVVALLFLSPLHHFQRTLDRVSHSLAGAYGMLREFVTGFGPREPDELPVPQPVPAGIVSDSPWGTADQEHINKLRQIFLFVCSGNTCRSPMAAAIGNAEIAARLQIPFENVVHANVQAISAGVSAKVGESMTAEAKQALRELGFHPNGHKAKNMTVELADQAEKIFCMTQAHRNAVIELIPGAAVKTQCLDPGGDVDDPIGSDLPAYIDCARRIHDLVRLRFDEISLRG